MTLAEFMMQIYPLLLAKTADRIDKDLTEGHVKAYWVGDLIRIDIQPRRDIPTEEGLPGHLAFGPPPTRPKGVSRG